MAIAVFILGRPGSGKDTQADILAEKLNLVRISTSDILKETLYDPELENDPGVSKEREIFESGLLCTPSFVLNVIKEHTKKLASKDFEGKNGIIFSGSPRTPYESEHLIPFLEELLGKENLLPVYLDISEEVGIERIKERNKINPRPLDEGEDKLKLRTKEFYEKTWPAIQQFEENGISLIKVNGELSVEKVHEEIMKHLEQ
jgi:adenylate kinase